MKDDLNKPEDKKQKQPKFEEEIHRPAYAATPRVDNSGEEKYPGVEKFDPQGAGAGGAAGT